MERDTNLPVKRIANKGVVATTIAGAMTVSNFNLNGLLKNSKKNTSKDEKDVIKLKIASYRREWKIAKKNRDFEKAKEIKIKIQKLKEKM